MCNDPNERDKRRLWRMIQSARIPSGAELLRQEREITVGVTHWCRGCEWAQPVGGGKYSCVRAGCPNTHAKYHLKRRDGNDQ